MREIIAVLHNIRSIHNVGSIFRTADAAGVSELVLCGITPTPLDRFGKLRRDFAKVSLGAEKTVRWRHERSALGAVRTLRKKGYCIYAVELSSDSIPYRRARARASRGKTALVFGNEVKGIPPSILRAADRILAIPMRGAKESLNVGVAFGIVAYGIQE